MKPGQYDYPPASESPDTTIPAYDFDAIPPNVQTLSQRLTDERFQAAFDFEAPRTSRAPPPRSPPDSESQSRMRSVLRAIRENEGPPPLDLALPPATSNDGFMPPPARRRAQPSGRFQRLNEGRAMRSQRPASNPTVDSNFNLHEASRRLARSNHDLRSLLDEPLEAMNRPRSVDADDMIHMSDSQHRRKRRRTEGAFLGKAADVHPVEYGFWGQVRPGSLDMEVRNTGDGDFPSTYDAADGWSALSQERIKNILREDSTAYYSRFSRTNIVLQHAGERLFSLNRLVIKTPDRPEDDFVLQGQVFASREIDATFERTATHTVHRSTTSQFNASSRDRRGGLRNYLRSSGIASDSTRHSPMPQGPEDVHQRQQIPADCDPESDTSESDDSRQPRQPGNVTGTQTSSAMPSDSESDTSMSRDEPSPPERSSAATNIRWRRLQVPRDLWREPGAEAPAGEDVFGDDTGEGLEDDAAQLDFDEVLRRGAAAHADRRRRRHAVRERVMRQRMQARLPGSEHAPTPPSDQPSIHPPFNSHSMHSHRDMHRFEPIEPPARPEDPRWQHSTRSLYADPSHPYSHPHGPWGVNVHERDATYNLLEPLAAFTTSHQARRRFSRPTKQASSLLDKTTSKPHSPSEDCKESVIISYKAKQYGGRVTVEFESPISARYVLLKLWKRPRSRTLRAEEHENVRLTRVRVEGWCGTRYFPAIDIA